MALDIVTESQGGFRVMKLSGRLDTETSADFELAAHDLLAAGDKKFVVDLTGISYVSSAGLRVLLALAKQSTGQQGELRLSGLAPAVKQVFDLSGFAKLFAIFPDLGQATGGAAAPVAKAAELLGASAPSKPSAPAQPVSRNAAELLGAGNAPAPKKGIFGRFLDWLRGY